jgi:hypothetical protein
MKCGAVSGGKPEEESVAAPPAKCDTCDPDGQFPSLEIGQIPPDGQNPFSNWANFEVGYEGQCTHHPGATFSTVAAMKAMS